MLGNFLHFLKYHNAVSIGVAFLFLSTAGAFAATPELRETVVKSEQRVTSVDNSHIINTNFDSYEPSVQVRGVTEDADAYYVMYELSTLGIVDAAWQPVTKRKELVVAKEALGEHDLGVYVSRELGEVVSRELSVLRETQQFEMRNGTQQKVVATEYSGLVGRFLDSSEQAFDGYQPVKQPPEPAVPQNNQVANAGNAAPHTNTEQNNAHSNTSNTKPQAGDVVTTTVSGGDDQVPPSIQILGNNPARVTVGSRWSDLGAYVRDNKNPNIGYKTEGADAVDTKTPGEYVITYSAEDQAGNTTKATRVVIVYDPHAPDDAPDQHTPTTTPQNTSTTTATSTEEAQTQNTGSTTTPQNASTTPQANALSGSDTSATTTATSSTPAAE